MTTLARVISRAFSEQSDGTQSELLKHLMLFGAAAVFVWILTLTYGVDLSPALF
ncbi:hypothetical protein ACQR0Z_26785 [Bradyrhizobium sp. HKCCYLS3077]|uniref:hypothetical protein n=1 Tax=Bradyrhizobium sp. HKCCYLS3077 TaxID=3420761 RepID=UPI003EC106F1